MKCAGAYTSCVCVCVKIGWMFLFRLQQATEKCVREVINETIHNARVFTSREQTAVIAFYFVHVSILIFCCHHFIRSCEYFSKHCTVIRCQFSLCHEYVCVFTDMYMYVCIRLPCAHKIIFGCLDTTRALCEENKGQLLSCHHSLRSNKTSFDVKMIPSLLNLLLVVLGSTGVGLSLVVLIALTWHLIQLSSLQRRP